MLTKSRNRLASDTLAKILFVKLNDPTLVAYRANRTQQKTAAENRRLIRKRKASQELATTANEQEALVVNLHEDGSESEEDSDTEDASAAEDTPQTSVDSEEDYEPDFMESSDEEESDFFDANLE